ncbi:MAG TPA: XdhC family protein [Kiritimatiellia bacterium]|nr:XdhC family protein [Kiritimatiellia bacterium]HMP34734.1 XdhC family protein [Kiritimatiellia bacterium]
MKTWHETVSVLQGIIEAQRREEPCALIILTRVKGSAFRRPGAKLLIRADGSMTGNVSGGCLENDLRERALAAMQTGAPVDVHYNTGSDEDTIWGLGLGCDGELDLRVLPVAPSAPWPTRLLEAFAPGAPICIAWPCGGEPSACHAANPAADVFLDHLEPPCDLVVVGAGDDAIPLVALAAEAGFTVTVSDHRPGYLAPERFPRAARILHLRPESAASHLPTHARTLVVIKNHALDMDRRWAAFFDTTDVAYLGLLGPRKRCDTLRAGLSGQRTDRIHGPAGLDLGAEGAEQIAVSIVAQLLAAATGRTPIHLRDREAPIHAR